MDVGSGSGLLSYFSLQAGAGHVFAVEATQLRVSHRGIEATRSHSNHRGGQLFSNSSSR